MVDKSENNTLLQWAEAIERLDYGSPGSDRSFGMKQRPDGDIEIDEKFWEEDFHIPTCQKCNGVLKPDVSFSLSLIEVNSLSIFFISKHRFNSFTVYWLLEILNVVHEVAVIVTKSVLGGLLNSNFFRSVSRIIYKHF